MNLFSKITYGGAVAGALLLVGSGCFAQKGVDTQTEKIKSEGNKVTSRSNDVSRSIDFGKGKTKTRGPLANPYKLSSRREVLIGSVMDTPREKKIIVDEGSSRPGAGLIVTQPFVFAKGSVIAQNQLSRFAVLDSFDTAWTQGRYTLTIEVQPIDGIQNNVSVVAKVEGRANNGMMSEWQTLASSGTAEDEFLSKLIELVTGNSPEPVQDKTP